VFSVRYGMNIYTKVLFLDEISLTCNSNVIVTLDSSPFATKRTTYA